MTDDVLLSKREYFAGQFIQAVLIYDAIVNNGRASEEQPKKLIMSAVKLADCFVQTLKEGEKND